MERWKFEGHGEFRQQGAEKLICPCSGSPKILFSRKFSGLLSVHGCQGEKSLKKNANSISLMPLVVFSHIQAE